MYTGRGGGYMADDQWKSDTAFARFQMITPLLEKSLEADKAMKAKKVQETASKYQVSERTIYRYLAAYSTNGFNGLMPSDKGHGVPKEVSPRFDDLFNEAKRLKAEVPQRSVNDIITILELEERAEPGELKRSTLQRHLYNAGFSKRQLIIHNENRTNAARRFCKAHRMQLVQGDIKYSSSAPITIAGKKVVVYLSSLLDDHSRFPLFSRWFPDQKKDRVEYSFREAILKYGVFDKAYVDHGGQYISKDLKKSCARLGIVIRHAPVKSGKSKGKVEKFHQVVDKFLLEASLKEYDSLEAFNYSWESYLEVKYTEESHGGIIEFYKAQDVEVDPKEMTPRKEFERDSRPLRFPDAAVVREAFLKHKPGRVSKGATVSVDGYYYGVNQEWIGASVDIFYDSSDLSTVTVKYPGVEPVKCSRVKIGEYVDFEQPVPKAVKDVKPTSSRMLDALEKKYAERKPSGKGISFAEYLEETNQNEEEKDK